ncbi:MAG: serine hydrolase domain-containing protein [Phototrophicaceae bacterium]|jgi:D-alanyl-D-alanine carboxypeptidase
MQRIGLGCWIVLCGVISIMAQSSYVTDDDLLAILQDYVVGDEPGAVVFVYDAGESYSAAFGLADLDSGEPIRSDDLFRIASISKQMVSAVMLTLVESGQVGLDDPIADYLPAEIVENVANADEATVRQILQMTSGIADYLATDGFYDAVYDTPKYFWTPEETIAFIYGEAPSFEAGEGYEYSNSNYNLAQIIIESVTGEPLADSLSARVFEPLGMESCYLETADTFAENIVRGYALDENDELADVTAINDGVGLGDGGVICTAEDLAKFPIGLLDGKLISDDVLAEMLTTVDDGEDGQYGLGIAYDEDPDYGETVWHDGATSGFQSILIYLPEAELSVVVLTNNFDAEAVEDIAYDAIALAFGE